MSEISLPAAFINRIKNDPFIENELIDSLSTSTPTSIRFNPRKLSKTPILQNTKQEISWCKDAFQHTERPIFTLDPHFHAGVYYPQEAGSMMLDTVLRQLNLPEEPIMLDLCAAPGGKSTLIASFLEGKGILLSNEIISNRSKILAENMNKWGFHNTLVCNNEPADFSRFTELFDCIVVDAPCSGEGMFRKDHQARTEWNEGAAELCAVRQLEILISIWSALKTNGYLIYSTCTFNETENEKTIQVLCQQFDCEIVSINADPFIKGRNGIGHYAFPHKLDTEGFYICVVQKKGQASKIWRNKSKHKSKKIAFSALRNLLPPALSSLEYFNDKELIQWQDFLFAVPKIHAERVLDFQSCLKIIKMGTEVGTIMNQKLIPNHALALDESLVEITETIELNKDQALNYLKGDTFPLEGKKGFQLVSYLGVNLGWINHLGNRFNNLYSKEWRIRMKID